MEKPTIYIGSDHGGFQQKEQLSKWLFELGYSVEDYGPHELDPTDDYPEYAIAVAEAVVMADAPVIGVITCRSAGGVTIAANKVIGARAVAIFDEKSAVHAKEHNNANIVTISGDWLSDQEAQVTLQVFLETKFTQKQRHVRRLAQISEYESSR